MTGFLPFDRRAGTLLIHATREAVLQSLALLAVVALALTSLGPMLDHHFAERHPGHQHLYLGSASPDHSHAYEHSHANHGAWMYAPSASDGKRSDGVVFVMPGDGAGNGAADIATPMVVQPPRFGGDDESVLRTPATDDSTMTGVVVPPSKLPPRA
jgi:hypothetical protein